MKSIKNVSPFWAVMTLLVVALLLFVGFLFLGGMGLPEGGLHNYELFKGKITEAVVEYQDGHQGALLLIQAGANASAEVTVDGEPRYIIDMCTLIEETEASLLLLESCAALGGPCDDNCDSPLADAGCTCELGGHYIWAAGSNASVYSICIGDACEAGGADGYQGVWP